MINENKNKLIVFLLSIATTGYSMNLTQPYDPFVQQERTKGYRLQFSVLGQGSFSSAKGYDEDGCRVNVLRIWNSDQNALKMLDGFDSDTKIGQMRVRVGANDDGVRGHFTVCGDYKKHGVSFSGRWRFHEDFSIVAHVPVWHDSLKNVLWSEQTKDLTADDIRTKQYLTDNFFDNVCTFGDDLWLQDWSRTGFGDISVLLEWLRDFKQTKEYLKNVRANARGGFVIPTGKKQDEDKLFALPFGTDGGLGLLFGAGLDVTLGTYMQAGFNVTLQHIFSNTRCRRIKTHEDQTELLLLAKTEVYKDFAVSQMFNLFIKGQNFIDRFSCLAGYQFFRRGDESLAILQNIYSEIIANSAKSLEEITMHNLFFSLNYDVMMKMKKEVGIRISKRL